MTADVDYDRDVTPAVITGITTYALAVPLPRPPADSHASLTHWTVPVVEVTTSDGLTGTGISGIHTGADLLSAVILDHYAPVLLGEDASLIRALWHKIYWSPLQWVGRAGITQLALSMIDIALWDLAAQRAALPLWKLLGAHHPRLETYNTDGGWLNRSEAELRDDLQSLVKEGWTSVKMKVGKSDWREDARRVQVARDAIGPDIELMCDANKMWTLQTAMKMLPVLREVGMGWIEEPLHPDDVDGHSRLQRLTDIPIAVGESLYSRFDFQRFAAADAFRVAQVDVTRVGGITEYLEIAAAMNGAGIPVVPHAGDMMVVHQHLAASSFSQQRIVEYLPWTLQAFHDPVRLEGTEIVLPETPGASTRIAASARQWDVQDVGGSAT